MKWYFLGSLSFEHPKRVHLCSYIHLELWSQNLRKKEKKITSQHQLCSSVVFVHRSCALKEDETMSFQCWYVQDALLPEKGLTPHWKFTLFH